MLEQLDQHSESLIRIGDQPVTELPDDLYIPPDALRVFLDAFAGPLDLLLYLIKKQNVDILDIPIVDITRQYMRYVELMKDLALELAGDYLLMAAMLAEIKSRLLLPKPASMDDTEEEDPRAELIRRLQAYECFKNAAENLKTLPLAERDLFVAAATLPPFHDTLPQPTVSIDDLVKAMSGVMKRARLFGHHNVVAEPLSIRERMGKIVAMVNTDTFTPFVAFFTKEEGRMGVVVTFIAILELIRESVLELVQSDAYAPIYVKARGGENE